MRNQNFYTIGGVTDDRKPLPPRLGGGVSYSGVAAKQLGLDVTIITKYGVGFKAVEELTQKGISVHRLPNRDPRFDNSTTSFENYEEGNRRWQVVPEQQEDISFDDLPNFPSIAEDSIILVAPVVGEVSPEIFPVLAEIGYLVVTPQGYFRHVEPDGTVTRKPWKDIQILSNAKMVILSDEDITLNNTLNEATLNTLRRVCPITVLTRGSKGLSIYQENKEIQIKALALKEKEIVDRIGAGDSCASAITWHYANFGDIRQAGVFGVLYAGLKIMGIGGKEGGIRSLPSLETVRSFISTHNDEKRTREFFLENAVTATSIFPEGNNRSIEKR